MSVCWFIFHWSLCFGLSQSQQLSNVSWRGDNMNTFSPLLSPLCGNPLVSFGFRVQRVGVLEIWYLFVGQDNTLNKKSSGQWNETHWLSCNIILIHFQGQLSSLKLSINLRIYLSFKSPEPWRMSVSYWHFSLIHVSWVMVLASIGATQHRTTTNLLAFVMPLEGSTWFGYVTVEEISILHCTSMSKQSDFKVTFTAFQCVDNTYRQTSNSSRTLVGNELLITQCNWSLACQRCSKYIFILDLTPDINGLGKDNCKMGRETLKVLHFCVLY